jgi:hypothetical protein
LVPLEAEVDPSFVRARVKNRRSRALRLLRIRGADGGADRLEEGARLRDGNPNVSAGSGDYVLGPGGTPHRESRRRTRKLPNELSLSNALKKARDPVESEGLKRVEPTSSALSPGRSAGRAASDRDESGRASAFRTLGATILVASEGLPYKSQTLRPASVTFSSSAAVDNEVLR